MRQPRKIAPLGYPGSTSARFSDDYLKTSGVFDFNIGLEPAEIWDVGVLFIDGLEQLRVIAIGLGSVNRFPIFDPTAEFGLPTSFVENSPEGFTLIASNPAGDLILSAPSGAIGDGEEFGTVFPGWNIFAVEDDLEGFFSDPLVRQASANLFLRWAVASSKQNWFASKG